MTDYATSDDYLDFTGAGSAPANIDALLRSASRMVRRDTVAAVYKVDTDGNATDTAVIEALRDATCAQAAAWSALGIDPLTGGVVTTKTVASKSLDGGSITYAGSKEAADARALATQQLVPNAVEILTDAGLLSGRPWTYG